MPGHTVFCFLHEIGEVRKPYSVFPRGDCGLVPHPCVIGQQVGKPRLKIGGVTKHRPLSHGQGIDAGLSYDQIWVTFYPQALDDDATRLSVEEIISHPDYLDDQPGDLHDIALVILEDPMQGIEPEALPELGYLDGVIPQGATGKSRKEVDLIVVGYGATDHELSPTEYPDIHLDAIRHVGAVSFQELLPFYIRLNLLSFPDNAFPCMGDSGGPMFHVEQHGNEVLVGLLGTYSSQFYYRLDTESAQEFIDANLPYD